MSPNFGRSSLLAGRWLQLDAVRTLVEAMWLQDGHWSQLIACRTLVAARCGEDVGRSSVVARRWVNDDGHRKEVVGGILNVGRSSVVAS
ncbi:hypothetical protein SESBI_32661 [Sesbania bispinosa]|nr:hypothetical protein SESBI_32661 [Sesbania bispinosa]